MEVSPDIADILVDVIAYKIYDLRLCKWVR